MKALFLVNARSGPRRTVDISSLIRSSCHGSDFEIEACQRKEDLDEIVARAEQTGYDAVFAVGGDGTVHEIAKRLIGRRLAMGIVPTGSGNGFARHLRLPMNASAAIAAGRGGTAVSIDTAEVNGMPFVGVMGVGFDAVIAREFAVRHARGLGTYLRAGFSAILRYRPEEYEVIADGERISSRAFAIAVANGSQYGNGFRLARNASVCDGVLDLVVFRDVPAIAAPVVVARLITGTLHRSSAAITRKVREVVIRRKSAGYAHLDGEPIELPEELNIRVRPRSLNVLVACDPNTI